MNDEPNSRELLGLFLRERSDAALARLIESHLDFVYSVALRHLRSEDLAGDVAQAVFCELVRNARKLHDHPNLTGWIYMTSRHLAARMNRSEIRRANREQAYAMNIQQEASAEQPRWCEVERVLDDALQDLSEQDREAVLLRYFRGESFKSIGAALGASENAARMRVERALEKLRAALQTRGITCPASVLGSVILANATTAAPVGLASALLAPTMAAATAGVVPLWGILQFMTATQVKTAAVALVLATSATGWLMAKRDATALRSELNALNAAASARPMQTGNADAAEINSEELDRLRAQHSELLRLRGEVTMLRNEARARAEKPTVAQSTRPQPAPDRSVEQAKLQELQISRMTTARTWYFALHDLVGEQDRPLPANLNAVLASRTNLAGDANLNAETANQFEVTYTGPLGAVLNPSEAIILREKEPFYVSPDGKSHRTYLFADGHSEVRVTSAADDSAWEEKHQPRVRMTAAAPEVLAQ